MKYFALFLATAGFIQAAEFTTGQAARLVLGQSTFTRQQLGASEFLLGGASGLAYANDTLFVVDANRVQASPQNNRVLIFRNLSSSLPAPKAELPKDGARCPVCTGMADTVVGQPDFAKTEIALSDAGFRTPTAVATDGRILVVADTDNNRVLIWNSIPTSNGTPANVVVGQPDFKTAALNFGGSGSSPSNKGLRGPQGVWLQDGKLYVADTQNHRVLVWNQVPNTNGKEADLVLGQPNFTAFVESDLTQATVVARANNLLNPVSVTSDGTRLYVADLGHNRVLVWNQLPTRNQEPADFALGQPDVATTAEAQNSAANNSPPLCTPVGSDSELKPVYPPLCAATLSFPRFALSDGKRLFVADGGNDRVLVYNTIPTRSGQPADVVLGQLTDILSQDSDGLRISSADSVRTPMSLAWDGANLFVSDPFSRRVMVFTLGDVPLQVTAVRNAASQEIFAVGTVTITAAPKENDEVTIKIGSVDYKYKTVKDDSVDKVITELVAAINAGAGDPLVVASPNLTFASIVLTSRVAGEPGNATTISATISAGAQIQVTASGATLGGGQDAAKIAPGALVTILGDGLADREAAAPEAEGLPDSLAGVQVYFDGIRAPLLFVSSKQINTQMPYEIYDASSVSAYVRTTMADGTVRVTNAIAVPIIPQNPGVFAEGGTDPRPAVAYHYSSAATGTISVDGSIKENDVATVKIEDREYKYTVAKDDTLAIVRDRLIEQINQDEKVEAFPAGVFTRIRLRARVNGADGEGIAYSASSNDGGSLILTALSPALCCANQEGARITEANPALPGETIIVYATGLGLVVPGEALTAATTGYKYRGPAENAPGYPVDSLAGGKTANVLFAGLKVGTIGLYELQLQLNSDIPTNPRTQLFIAQDFVSNLVTIPVKNPNQEE